MFLYLLMVEKSKRRATQIESASPVGDEVEVYAGIGGELPFDIAEAHVGLKGSIEVSGEVCLAPPPTGSEPESPWELKGCISAYAVCKLFSLVEYEYEKPIFCAGS